MAADVHAPDAGELRRPVAGGLHRQRVVSNTPQQALTLLNSPIFIEAARVFAGRLLAAEQADEQRLDAAFERALARKPKAEEKTALLKYLAEQTTYFRAHPEAAKKLLTIGQAPLPAGVDEPTLAGWTAVCRVLLNLHETITRVLEPLAASQTA